ncbi:MAG: electron transfer flavoprotein subunit beta/FixA family protein [Candidatus Brocadiae bacterium]|nr:electron transfer flavoprotein subunit beta/FixA family protein [Candidatus Brocadiia bacterium]
MKIVVCVKRVPDTALKVKIGSDRKSIEKGDVEYIVSPYDEIAVEHAIRFKEKTPGTEVVVVTLGPADSEKNMRTCLAMGADRGILLQSNADTMDSFNVAKALSDAISQEKPDLVLFGIKATDTDSSQVGAIVSMLLGIPFLSTVVSFSLENGKIKADSEVESGHLVLQSTIPCALSIQKSNVDPRICSLINIRKAKQKELKIVPVDIPNDHFEIEKMELPAERTGGKIVGHGPDAVKELLRLLHEEAKVI